MDIVDTIAEVQTGNVMQYQDVPLEPIIIESVKIIQ
jgi:Peptidyl-prolyl cis-trans isomerase (rotamase) - cyclophilin family